MGLFDKLFGRKEESNQKPKDLIDTSSLKMTSKMMEEKQYWDIVQRSLNETKNQDAQEAWLIEELRKLPLEEIIGFRLRTDWLLYQSYTSDILCANYIMEGGCSDDSFEYFRCWLISRGEEAYNNAMQNPDSLIDEVVDGRKYYDFESFWYVALVAFEKNTGKELYDFIDYDTFTTCEENYPGFESDWEDDIPESVKRICPRLFERFN